MKEQNSSKENEEIQSEKSKSPAEEQRKSIISVTSSTTESLFCSPQVEVYPALPWLQAGEHHVPDGVEEVGC